MQNESDSKIRRIQLDWMVGHATNLDDDPEQLIPASVPGAVQLDWAKAKGWSPYWIGDNCKDYAWMEDCAWQYRATVPPVKLAEGEQLFFVCGGVDYRVTLKLDRKIIHEQEGMFRPFSADLSSVAAAGAMLRLVVHPVPKANQAPIDRAQARLSVKPAVAYGWDFHPRLIPLGIWEDTYLEVRPAVRIEHSEVRYRLNESLSEANLNAEVRLSRLPQGHTMRWTMTDAAGKTCLKQEITADKMGPAWAATLPNPQLWWPHDHGTPYLYTSLIELLDAAGRRIDANAQKIGIRRIRLVVHEGGWRSPSSLPTSRTPPPITVEINGRPIFAKGSNWVCPEIFPGLITRTTYEPLLQLARDAHFNLLRCWGGAIVNKESFFELCDELGLLVWQEFPLSCNLYDGGEEYLRVLDLESKAILLRLRRHTSVALWCGGNELFNVWSGMNEQSAAIRLLQRNSYDLHPEAPFIPSSPLEGMGHGDYRFRSKVGREVFQMFHGSVHTAYTEFGCPGPSPAEYLKTFIPEDQLWPPRPGTAWETHGALNAWEVNGSAWLFPEMIASYFGPPIDLDDLVHNGQLLQSQGYKCLFEEARRQKPVCSMALNWCLNEPWPTAANNSLVNWPAQPKPAYFAAADSCRPVIVSARFQKFEWKAGELFEAELWLLNDRYETIPSGQISLRLKFGELEIPVITWHHGSAEANRNLAGPTGRLILPDVADVNSLTVEVTAEAHADWNSSYTLLYRSATASPDVMIPGNPFGVSKMEISG